MSEIKVISLSDFLHEICPLCFVCGDPDYQVYNIGGWLYQVCDKCMVSNRNGVSDFLDKMNEKANKKEVKA